MVALAADVVLETRSVHSLGQSELERCRSLTHGKGGSMYEQLGFSRNEPERLSKVILARHRYTNRILGWAIVFRIGDSPWHAYFYVDYDERGRGIGNAIAKEVLRRTRGEVVIWTRRFTYPRYKATG